MAQCCVGICVGEHRLRQHTLPWRKGERLVVAVLVCRTANCTSHVCRIAAKYTRMRARTDVTADEIAKDRAP